MATPIFNSRSVLFVLYLYSAKVSIYYRTQITHLTSQVQPNSQVADIPLSDRQGLKDDHLSTSLRFFILLLGIGPNDRGPPF